MHRFWQIPGSLIAMLSITTVAAASDSSTAATPLKRRTIEVMAAGKEVAGMMLPMGTPANIQLKAQKTEFGPDGTLHASGHVQLSLFLDKLPPLTLYGDEVTMRSEVLDAEQARAVHDLEQMGASDQSLRANPSAMTASDIERQAAIDVANMKRLAAIIERYGWPGNRFAGAQNAGAAFLVLQHADAASQQKYLPLLRAAVAKGDAASADLALLEDRVLVRNGKPQRYGSQFKSTKPLELYPVEDEAHLEQRRREMGLPPMDEYLQTIRQLYHAQ